MEQMRGDQIGLRSLTFWRHFAHGYMCVCVRAMEVPARKGAYWPLSFNKKKLMS